MIQNTIMDTKAILLPDSPREAARTPTPERELEFRGRKKTHQRAITAVRISDMVEPQGSGILNGASTLTSFEESLADIKEVDNQESKSFEKPVGKQQKRPSSLPASTSSVENTAYQSSGSGSSSESGSSESGSSESGSTVVGSAYEGRDGRLKKDRKAKGSPLTKLDALQYLDPDSPAISPSDVSKQGIACYQSSVSPVNTSPSSRSATSSYRGSFHSDRHSAIADHDTDRSTSPDQSPPNRAQYARIAPQSSRRHRSYGTPEMPRGTAELPHISPKILTSRVPGQPQGHVIHLPRAEKLPTTGYEQLACQLASQGSDLSGPYLRPMYRRFEKLNHRMLLHLQDELCELEEQLHRLDTTDTQTRRLHNGILPASRRAEAVSGGELQWHKTDILGKIGFKLEQYNRVLSSFQATETLETPSMADINEYRGYLTTHPLIADAETHFLDAGEDLICLGQQSESEGYDEDMATTPMPRRASIFFGAAKSHAEIAQSGYFSTYVNDDVPEHLPIPITLVMVIAVIVPTLTFGAIPGYLGRMAVVVLVGVGVLGVLIQSHIIGTRATKDFCICAGAYGTLMAVIAAVWQ